MVFMVLDTEVEMMHLDVDSNSKAHPTVQRACIMESDLGEKFTHTHTHGVKGHDAVVEQTMSFRVSGALEEDVYFMLPGLSLI